MPLKRATPAIGASAFCLLAPPARSVSQPPQRSRWLFGLGLAALNLTSAPAWAQQGEFATLVSFSDRIAVTLSLNGRPILPVQRRMPLHPGYVLHTIAPGQADVLFTNGREAKVDANTTLEFSPTPRHPVRVHRGKIRFRLASGGGLSVLTPAATCYSSHTDFQVEVVGEPGQEQTILTVIEGDVQFSNGQGRVVVREHEKSTARRGEKPAAPVAVTNLPQLIQWSEEVQPVALELETVYVSQDPAVLQAARREAEAVPAGWERWQRLGDVQHDLGRFDDPRHFQGYYAQALADYQSAWAVLPPAIADAQRARLQARMGETWLAMGNVAKAKAAFDQSLSLNPEETSARVGRVLALLSERGEEAGALAEAQTAVKLDGRSPTAQTALALALIRRREKDAALETLDRVIALDPKYSPAYAWKSFLLRTAARPEAALEAAQQAVERAPFSSLAHQSLAEAWFAQDQVRKARAEAQQAVALDPLAPGAHASLGRVLLQGGDLDGAVREASKAVALGPNLERAHFLLGLGLWEQRRLERAATEFEKAVELDPGYLEARAYLAQVYVAQGRQAQARAVARAAQVQNPNFPAVRAALGRIDYMAGLLQEAVTEYRTALDLLKGKPGPAYEIGLARAYLEENDLPDALEHALKAVSEVPGSHEAHAVLGLVYDRQENREQAIREYQEALSLSPDNSLARLGLETAFTPASFRFFGSGDEQLRERAQALLRDPAVLEQVFKPGKTSELSGTYGQENQQVQQYLHRGQSSRGQVHDLSVASRFSDSGYRANSHYHGHNLQSDVAAEATPNTQVLLQYVDQRLSAGLPGLVDSPDTDANSRIRRTDYNLHVRHYLGSGTHLWLGQGFRIVQNFRHDPDSDAPFFQSNARRQESVSELRLDHTVGSHRLSYGVMRLGEKVRFLQEYSTHTGAPNGPVPRGADEEDEVKDAIRDFLQYYQDDYRFGDRGTLIIGVQWLRTKERQTVQPHLLTGAFATPQVPPSAPPAVRRDDLLPYLALTYNVDARNLIRLIGNKKRVRFGGPLLAPSEAFIVEEPVNVLDGQIETYELDYERRFSARTFGKLFLQSSVAYRWNIQPTLDQSFDTRELIIPKVEERLVGLLVEHQITRYLSSLTRLEYVQAEDRTRIAYGPDGQLLGSVPNPSRGLQVPISPQWRGLFGFNYVDRSGTKVGLMAGVFSREFIDVESGSPFNMSEFGGRDFQRNQKRVSFQARTLFNLRIAKEPSLGVEYGLIVSNLFNTRIPDWPSYPRRGRLWYLEIARRF